MTILSSESRRSAGGPNSGPRDLLTQEVSPGEIMKNGACVGTPRTAMSIIHSPSPTRFAAVRSFAFRGCVALPSAILRERARRHLHFRRRSPTNCKNLGYSKFHSCGLEEPQEAAFAVEIFIRLNWSRRGGNLPYSSPPDAKRVRHSTH